MKLQPHILIVDDSEDFLDAYRDILGREGYAVTTVSSSRDALLQLGQGEWDAVLLDQKLMGPGGPDGGLDLVEEVLSRAPGAKPIMVTAYANPNAIRRAFEKGVYDYLQKDALLEPLLVAKLRNAVEAVHARRLTNLGEEALEQEVRTVWSVLASEADPNTRGRRLENLMELIFKSIAGFRQVDSRVRNDLEEIDLIIRNESSDPFWAKESPYILVECKNWSRPAGVPEYRLFKDKIEKKYGRARLGVFVAPGGLTGPFKEERRLGREGDTLVIVIDAAGLETLVQSRERGTWLKEAHQRAVTLSNGH